MVRPERASRSWRLVLAERWQQKYAAERVVVTCGADYARSYANAVDTNHLAMFRKKSRAMDLFVLDDVHHMQQKRQPKRNWLAQLM